MATSGRVEPGVGAHDHPRLRRVTRRAPRHPSLPYRRASVSLDRREPPVADGRLRESHAGATQYWAYISDCIAIVV